MWRRPSGCGRMAGMTQKGVLYTRSRPAASRKEAAGLERGEALAALSAFSGDNPPDLSPGER